MVARGRGFSASARGSGDGVNLCSYWAINIENHTNKDLSYSVLRKSIVPKKALLEKM